MIFNETSASARQKHWENLQTVQPYNQWMNIGESSGLEPFMRNVRNKLEEAGRTVKYCENIITGVLLEAIHPEFMPSQHELNFVPADPMTMADRHIIAKHGIRDMAKQSGMTTSFVAKLDSNGFGSACHIHSYCLYINSNKFLKFSVTSGY